MSKETGGSAFPTSNWQKMAPLSNGYHEGMDLRDYFAAEAMKMFIDKDQWQSTIGDVAGSVAFNAYAMADAMLEERTK